MNPIIVKNQSLGEVLSDIGWRSEPSLLEGRRRLFDATNCLVNICTDEETWLILEELGLIVMARDAYTAIAFKGTA